MADVVLVTGAGGCIAAWVVKALVDRGATVIGFDLSADRRRAALALTEREIAAVTWETGDIADPDALLACAERHAATAIIHLAALQVPFCKADPFAGARVNVLGTVAVLETARHLGLKRLAYASSIAIQAMTPGSPWLRTLYGAHKACGEAMAQIYWQDWQVPSVGIRPGVVYGPGRDQGMSAAPTFAMLAAAAGRPYTVPFSGPFPFLYVKEAAAAFVAAVSHDRNGAEIFDLNGVASTIETCLARIESLNPGAALSCAGPQFPFPADISDEPIGRAIGPYRRWSLEDGIAETLATFRSLLTDGRLSPTSID